MKHLILNADDYGMNEAVSRGILEAAAGGALRSTTAMASCGDLDRAMDELAESGRALDVGIHLNLSWGSPLSRPEDIPSLVDGEGRFHSRAHLMSRAIAGSVSWEEACREFRLQCERLATRVDRITHLDGHHHVHSFPTICRAAERVAREFNIPYVRTPREGLWSPWYWSPARRMAIALFSASGKGYWRSRGFNTSDYFGGFALGGVDGFENRWLKTLASLPDGICEIMVHPGYSSSENDSYDVERSVELEWLKGEEFMNAARESNVTFSSFGEVDRASSAT